VDELVECSVAPDPTLRQILFEIDVDQGDEPGMPTGHRQRLRQHPAGEHQQLGRFGPRQHRRRTDAAGRIAEPDRYAGVLTLTVELEQRVMARVDRSAVDLDREAGVATALAEQPTLALGPAPIEGPAVDLDPGQQARLTTTVLDHRGTLGPEPQARALALIVDVVKHDRAGLERERGVDREPEHLQHPRASQRLAGQLALATKHRAEHVGELMRIEAEPEELRRARGPEL